MTKIVKNNLFYIGYNILFIMALIANAENEKSIKILALQTQNNNNILLLL